MNTDKDRKKKKGRRILKRKSKKANDQSVEEVTSLVNDLKVVPDITVAETQSQPQSRRSSNTSQLIPVQLMLNPKEITRRASDASAMQVEYKDEEKPRRRDSITRRGSVKRVSLTWQEAEELKRLETKKLKAALEAMGMIKKAQKEFTWDSVKPEHSDIKVKRLVMFQMVQKDIFLLK